MKSLLAVATVAFATLLAGCGGGGAVTPSCADNNSCPVAVPPLVVNPSVLNIYAGTPSVVTISSGVGPFQVFTSDAIVLPVSQVVSGAAVTLVASAVTADQVVSLTIQDAAGQRVVLTVTVKPSPLIGALSVIPTTNTTCAGVAASISDKAAVCSGESALASVTLRSNATSVLANRQVRFDVVQGAYNFLIDQSGLMAAKFYTVLTDQNGKADAALRTDAAVPSQVALIRATDVVTGNRVDSSFTIVQAISGAGVLSIVPPLWTVTGYFKGECPGAGADFLIYGGKAPYTVTNTLPGSFVLTVNGISSSTSVIVSQAGGRFTASTAYSAACVGGDGIFVVTDATGRNANATLSIKPGTVDRVASTISPTAVTINAAGFAPGTCIGNTVNFTGATGVGPLTWSVSSNRVSVSPTTGNSTVLTVGTLNGGDVVTVTAVDTAGKLTTATVTCAASTTVPPPLPALVISPTDVTLISTGGMVGPPVVPGSCTGGGTIRFTVTGGGGFGIFTASRGMVDAGGLFTLPISPRLAAGEAATVTYADSSTGKLVSGTVSCK